MAPAPTIVLLFGAGPSLWAPRVAWGRARLGQTEGGIVAPFPDKPKGMRWHSYLRLRRDAEAREAQVWHDAARQFSTG